MKNPLLPFLLVGSIAVAGCLLPAQQTVPFSDADFRSFRGPGSAAITGHVFLTNSNDRVVSGAGYEVDLTPATPYTKERYEITSSGRSIQAPDPGLSQYVRTTVTNYMGNFAFRGLPPGQYFLSATLTWDVPSKFQANSVVPMAKQVFATATVAAGDSVKIVLTNPQ